MESKNFDIWDETNQIIQTQYTKDNYKVIDYKNKSNIAIIFFSSNGLYYPNTQEEFIEKLYVRDKYEWDNISQLPEIKKYARRVILVRDIYKQWYVKGINHKYNSQDLLLKLLKNLCSSYEVITLGTSSGGYIASLAGCYLNAKIVFSISGQFELKETYGKMVTELIRYNAEKSNYLINLLNKSTPPPRFIIFAHI